jgi:hypothetical protein
MTGCCHSLLYTVNEVRMSDEIEALFPEEMAPTAEAVRALVLKLLPKTREKVRVGRAWL